MEGLSRPKPTLATVSSPTSRAQASQQWSSTTVFRAGSGLLDTDGLAVRPDVRARVLTIALKQRIAAPRDRRCRHHRHARARHDDSRRGRRVAPGDASGVIETIAKAVRTGAVDRT